MSVWFITVLAKDNYTVVNAIERFSAVSHLGNLFDRKTKFTDDAKSTIASKSYLLGTALFIYIQGSTRALWQINLSALL